ncbi:MAG: transglycosylase domain-containing protein, partial [Bacteroidales bacterium]|nr:transglycosylase domain-containing protein [Bacteroidales bacterium]
MKPAVRNLLLLVALAAGTAYLFCLPRDLFKGTCYSTVVTDRNGELLGARIAADGQWRFPVTDTVPEKFRTALVTFEDRWFYVHPGVNPVSIVRAAAGNLKAGRITGGGSTLTMQVIRMSRRKERTLWQKMIEAVLATRLELR